MEASKLGFSFVIERSDNGTRRRQPFVVMTCERSGKHVQKLRKIKHDDTGSRKCECPFKLHGYCRVDGFWRYNVMSGMHNHALGTKLHGHPIVCRLKTVEKEFISEYSLIKVVERNILVGLKWNKLECVSNIKSDYNHRYK